MSTPPCIGALLRGGGCVGFTFLLGTLAMFAARSAGVSANGLSEAS